MKVYAIEAGEYSGFHIPCIFSTRELAEEYLRRYREGDDSYGSPNDIREYEVDAEPMPEWKEVLTLVERLDPSGHHVEAEGLRSEWVDTMNWHGEETSTDVEEGWWRGTPTTCVTVEGPDHDRVRKRFSELKAQTVYELANGRDQRQPFDYDNPRPTLTSGG